MPKKRKKKSPEPGDWVYDMPKGMSVGRPRDLPSGTLGNEVISEWVRYHGLGHCILELIPTSRIEDPLVMGYWRRARSNMKQIAKYLDL